MTSCLIPKDGSAPSSAEACRKSLAALIPKLCQMVAEDEDTDVVCVCLENVARLLKVCWTFDLNLKSDITIVRRSHTIC